jgi:hypothetical protein
MAGSFDELVIAAFRGRTAAELAKAPPDALMGVSAADARHLDDAFGITTVAELAASGPFHAATAIARAASAPGFDPGPPPAWEAQFAAAPLAAFEARPDLFRLDFGPVYYRGRLDGTARVLVVGQDPSVNEILAQRVFVGQSGQRLQGLLGKAGLSRSYVMLNTFLFSIFGQFGGDNAALSRQDPIRSYRNALFDRVADTNPLGAVLTVGTAARDAVDRWPGSGAFVRVHVLHPAFPNTAMLLADWNDGLTDLVAAVEPDDSSAPGAPYGNQFSPGDILPVPRADLPFGLPAWHGVGDHGRRDGDDVIEWHATPV